MFKNILIYVAGIVTGVILVITASMFFVRLNSIDERINLFEEEGGCVSCSSFKIIQVLDTGDALANEIEPENSRATGLTVLFLKNSKESYYDDQIIKMQTGKCAKQIGIYKYISNVGIEKTVPVVDIRDK